MQFSEKHRTHTLARSKSQTLSKWNAPTGASHHTSQRAVGRKGSPTQKARAIVLRFCWRVCRRKHSLFASMRMLGAFALSHSVAIVPNDTNIRANQNALIEVGWMMHYREQCPLWINWINLVMCVCAIQLIEKSSTCLQEEISSKRHPLPSIFNKTRTKQIFKKVTKT